MDLDICMDYSGQLQQNVCTVQDVWDFCGLQFVESYCAAYSMGTAILSLCSVSRNICIIIRRGTALSEWALSYCSSYWSNDTVVIGHPVLFELCEYCLSVS